MKTPLEPCDFVSCVAEFRNVALVCFTLCGNFNLSRENTMEFLAGDLLTCLFGNIFVVDIKASSINCNKRCVCTTYSDAGVF